MLFHFHQKKSVFCTLLVLSICIAMLSGCTHSSKEQKPSDTSGKKVILNEVAHSIFYAPMYVAIEEGYFKDAGIDLELVNGLGADKTMTAVLSGEADIGFMGPESTVYTYNEGATDVVVNFAQLTQRAGNFLIARESMEDFAWSDLKGKTVLGGRAGGMPEMVFEFVLKKNNIDPTKDLTINQNIDFGSTAAAFAGGQGDFSVEFEPGATALEAEGSGYVVASLGVDSGYVPYTAFSAKESFIQKNPETIQAFTDALQKGMQFVREHSCEEIAAAISPQFPETDEATIAAIVNRYQSQDTWKTDVIFSEDAYILLLDILEESNQLSDRPKYEKLVTTEFAKKAIK